VLSTCNTAAGETGDAEALSGLAGVALVRQLERGVKLTTKTWRRAGSS
jgi:CHAT domain-containing protein